MNSEVGRRERVEFLRSTPFLAGLQEESWNILADAGRFVKIAKGYFLFYQHEPAKAIYILRSGELAVVLMSYDGRELIINEIKPGDAFGELSILTSAEGRTAGVQAREDSEVLEISGRAFMAVLDREPAVARRMLEVATQRLFKAHQRESALAFLDAPARIARVILEMDKIDRAGPDKGYITLSQEELAQRTGLTSQTVANNLSKWRRKNWLLTGRGRIMILNREALQRVAEEGNP